MVRQMRDDDFDWAASLMERRRQEYVEYSPVFWRPAKGVASAHADHLRVAAARPGAVAVRTDRGFALSAPSGGRCFVDDLAVETPDLWSTDGRELVCSIWRAARSEEQRTVRVVTARRDEPKRQLLSDLGLVVAARWWVKELEPDGESATWGPVQLGGVEALVMPAPPVYDPGGPVCLLGDLASERAGAAATAAAGVGAVLAIVTRDGSPVVPPASDPELEGAGFHNASEFYEGIPS